MILAGSADVVRGNTIRDVGWNPRSTTESTESTPRVPTSASSATRSPVFPTAAVFRCARGTPPSWEHDQRWPDCDRVLRRAVGVRHNGGLGQPSARDHEVGVLLRHRRRGGLRPLGQHVLDVRRYMLRPRRHPDGADHDHGNRLLGSSSSRCRPGIGTAPLLQGVQERVRGLARLRLGRTRAQLRPLPRAFRPGRRRSRRASAKAGKGAAAYRLCRRANGIPPTPPPVPLSGDTQRSPPADDQSVLLLKSPGDLATKKPAFVVVALLRLTPVRKLALRLSDRNIGRSTIDAGLSAHAASRLEQRTADEAARRVPDYALESHAPVGRWTTVRRRPARLQPRPDHPVACLSGTWTI